LIPSCGLSFPRLPANPLNRNFEDPERNISLNPLNLNLNCVSLSVLFGPTPSTYHFDLNTRNLIHQVCCKHLPLFFDATAPLQSSIRQDGLPHLLHPSAPFSAKFVWTQNLDTLPVKSDLLFANLAKKENSAQPSFCQKLCLIACRI
jgi:hypothetical protein